MRRSPHLNCPCLVALALGTISLLFSACSHTPIVGSAHRATGLPPRAEAVQADTEIARSLLGASLDWRERAVQFLAEATPRVESGVPLTAADLNALHRGGEDYVFITRRWQALVFAQGPEAWTRDATLLAFDPVVRTQAKLALASTLVQYDDYHLGVAPYIQQPKLRRLLKTDNPAVFGELDAATARFVHSTFQSQLARGVDWHQSLPSRTDETPGAASHSGDERFLDEVITQSAGYRSLTRQSIVTRALTGSVSGVHAVTTSVVDSVAHLGRATAHQSSRVVGNSLGLVASRRGWLEAMPAEERAALAADLRPLDVLLEKTPFRLTDASIPGFYGHVAIWVGTESELRALGVWDEPLVRPHHERIRAGASIIEALRPGVQINTLADFLNIDDLLVVRPPVMTEDETRAAVLRCFAQIGKEYDFNFDVESDRRIVCSELAYVVFPSIDWPTKAVLGRHSISPDQVAVRALAGEPFTPQILYHDGVRIQKNLPESLALLLREDEEGFRDLHSGFKRQR